MNFWAGFEKRAKDQSPEGHMLRRGFLGPLSNAVEAKRGQKAKAFVHGTAHLLKHTAAGIAAAGVPGAVAGALLSPKGQRLVGAKAGATLGAALGSTAGGITGIFGGEASRIHGMYSKHRE